MGTGNTIHVNGGAGRGPIDKTDIFLVIAGVLLILFVIKMNGSSEADKNMITLQHVPGTAVMLHQSPVTQPQAGQSTPSTTAAPSSSAVPLMRTNSTESAPNNATDKPDASIEASLQAGSDQTGPPSQMGDAQNLKEIHGQKFVIGESMQGRQPHRKSRGWSMLFKKRENSTADSLIDQGKKAKQDLTTEHTVADQLQSHAKDLNKMVRTSRQGKESMYGIPYHADVGGAPTDDPFDVFSEPEAQIQTRPNIDFTGYGHTKYLAGDVEQYNRVFYPTDGRVFFYRDKGTSTKRYSENNPYPHTYSQIAQQNNMVQAKYNKEGFYMANPANPDTIRKRYPNNDFLAKDTPNFFSHEYMKGIGKNEREIGMELGNTGHSFTDNNAKSGLESTEPAGPNTDIGTGSGAFTRDNNTMSRDVNVGGLVHPGQIKQTDADASQMKVKVRGSIAKILKLFDRIFSEEIFPGSVVDVQTDGTLYIRDGKEGPCILLGRFYEYVQNSIRATVGLGRTAPLSWAKSIDLNFEAIEKNKIPLRAALTEQCSVAGAYILSPDGTIKTADGKKIEIIIPWPADQTILISHSLKIGSV